VFEGNAAGDFIAYRASTGDRLAAVSTERASLQRQVSYEIGGEQYVAVLGGFGGGAAPMYEPGVAARERENHGRIFAFKLGGTAVALPPKRSAGVTPELPPLAFYSDSLEIRGSDHFRANCIMCHAGRGDDEPGRIRRSSG
jgi:quinohemoprotein ethanol dehydrogenase